MRERKLTRLKGYDYSMPGAYFVTICAQDRNCLFGKVENGQMRLNDMGQMVDIWWRKIFDRYNNISADEYIIMPNHIHGIINIVGAIPCNRPVNNVKNETAIHDDRGENMVLRRGENMVSPLRISNTYAGLGQYVSWFKRMSTTEYIQHVKNDNWQPFDKRIWQRNYYEHVIRNDAELNRIRQYIIENPLKWDMDSEHPNNIIRKRLNRKSTCAKIAQV